MPKRRDYKAEYAATKARAQAGGYASEREYRKARRAANTPRGAMPVRRGQLEAIQPGALERGAAAIREDRRLRRVARAWSDKRSHVPETQYRKTFDEPTVEAYVDVWVNKPKRVGPGAHDLHIQKMREYLVDRMGYMTDEEFRERYGDK